MRPDNDLNEAKRYSSYAEDGPRAIALALIDIAWTLRDIHDELHNDGNGFEVRSK